MKHALVVFLLILQGGLAQQPVDPHMRYYRLLCVVPMVGSGAAADPHRPEYAPLPGSHQDPKVPGIVAFAFQLSDDGQHALVEFAARDRAAFKAILADTRPDVKVFEIGKAARADIENAFRLYKKNLDLDSLRMVLP